MLYYLFLVFGGRNKWSFFLVLIVLVESREQRSGKSSYQAETIKIIQLAKK